MNCVCLINNPQLLWATIASTTALIRNQRRENGHLTPQEMLLCYHKTMWYSGHLAQGLDELIHFSFSYLSTLSTQICPALQSSVLFRLQGQHVLQVYRILRGSVIFVGQQAPRCAKAARWGLNGISIENGCLELQVILCKC